MEGYSVQAPFGFTRYGGVRAEWLPPRRLPGPAAGHDALAGAIAGAIGDALEGPGVDPAALWETFASVVGSIACGTGCYALGVGIADLAGSESIETAHLAEAIQYRPRTHM